MITKSRASLAVALLAVMPGGAAQAQQDEAHVVLPIEAINGALVRPRFLPEPKPFCCTATRPRPNCSSCRFPKGYRVAPHTHPRPEVVTVISGRATLGYGKLADNARTHRLTPGTFMVTLANAPHYASFEDDTVLQLNTVGPWSVTYVNPADDPRNKAR